MHVAERLVGADPGCARAAPKAPGCRCSAGPTRAGRRPTTCAARRWSPMLPLSGAAGLELRGHDYLAGALRGHPPAWGGHAGQFRSRPRSAGADAVLLTSNHPNTPSFRFFGALLLRRCGGRRSSSTRGGSSTSDASWRRGRLVRVRGHADMASSPRPFGGGAGLRRRPSGRAAGSTRGHALTLVDDLLPRPVGRGAGGALCPAGRAIRPG